MRSQSIRAGVLAGLMACAVAAPGSAWAAIAHAGESSPIQHFLLPGYIAPVSMVFGPDGALWFTAEDRQPGAVPVEEIGRMTTSGSVQMFSVPDASDAEGGIVSSAGALWFAPANSGVTTGEGGIGEITTSGSVSEFPASSDGAIAAGPDGNVWVDDSGAIDSVSPTGAIQQLDYPDGWGPAAAITAGPDGALWIAGADANGNPAIGRMTTSGSFTSYSVPQNSDWYVRDITAGPDGALWFTEIDQSDSLTAGWIGRITTQGQVSEWRIPPDASGNHLYPISITTGPDGALWFTNDYSTEGGPVDIGRITTTGKFSFYYLAQGGNFGGPIISGPDGRLWIGFGFAGIGRLAPGTPPGQLTWGTPALQCVVPHLKGVKLNLARLKLAAANCRLGRIKVGPPKPGPKADRVLSQSAKPGSKHRAGYKVSVTVSTLKLG